MLIKILKTHPRAEDCRTMHYLHKDSVIDVSEEFAKKIIKDGDGILYQENFQEKSFEKSPENKMFNSENLENKTIEIIDLKPTEKESVVPEPITKENTSTKFNIFKKRK